MCSSLWVEQQHRAGRIILYDDVFVRHQTVIRLPWKTERWLIFKEFQAKTRNRFECVRDKMENIYSVFLLQNTLSAHSICANSDDCFSFSFTFVLRTASNALTTRHIFGISADSNKSHSAYVWRVTHSWHIYIIEAVYSVGRLLCAWSVWDFNFLFFVCL